MINFDKTRLGLLEVRVDCIGCRLHMRTQVLLVLSIGLVLDILKLWSCSSLPFSFGILLSLFDAMGAICSILAFCESRYRSINTFIKDLYIGSDLINLRGHIGLVVGI